MEPFLFIVGAGRSGTTLLRAMFDSHPDMAIPGESSFVVRLANERPRYEVDGMFAASRFAEDLARHPLFQQWEVPEEELRRAFAEPVDGYADAIRRVYRLYARTMGKSRFGDKTPGYMVHLNLLSGLFPEARFVHLIRDGRDVALSQLDFQAWGARTLEEAAVDWRRRVILCRRDGRSLGPRRYREVRYEDLIQDPEAVVRAICAFIDLDFDVAMLRYFERADQVAGDVPHFQNLYLPPTKGLRDWKTQMTDRDVAVFESIAGDLLIELGYEPANRHPGMMTRIAASGRRLQVQFRWLRRKVRRSTHRRGRSRRWRNEQMPIATPERQKT